MKFIIPNYSDYDGKDAVGTGQCVALIQQALKEKIGYSGELRTSFWKGRSKVLGSTFIEAGTAIATFDDNGKYPNRATGNHAAIFLSKTQSTIDVLDQWKGKGKISKRTIVAKKKHNSHHMTNDAEFYYVIEI